MRFVTLLAALAAGVSLAPGQAHPAPQANLKMLTDAAAKGTPLKIKNVDQNISAAAVLIPRTDARRIFGKEIAENYAVIEVNIGNKSQDASFIVHGMFVDYLGWALGGAKPVAPPEKTPDQDFPSSFQASTRPNQIASEEYRVVRGQLLDAQMWSARNWTVRLLTLAGSIAGGYSFAFKEVGIAKGIAAFSGDFVPGVDKAWPDGTVDQLNRISDFGFQTNKVIPKTGGLVVVCFFPIDRFLSKGFRELFLKSPALFFSPFQMLVDATMKKAVQKALGENLGGKISLKQLKEKLPCFIRVTQGEIPEPSSAASAASNLRAAANQAAYGACLASLGLSSDGKIIVDKDLFAAFVELYYISQMSLDALKISIDGIMTVDTSSLTAKVDSVKLDQVASGCADITPCFWADPSSGAGVRTGSVNGSYLTGGTIAIVEANSLGISDVKTITDGSTDQVLKFSFKISKAIPPGTKLHLTVTKAAPAGQDAKNANPSQQFEYDVKYDLAAPAISGVTKTGQSLTVAGTGFYDVPPDDSLTIVLRPPSGSDVSVKPVSTSPSSIKIDIPSTVTAPGCWNVVASVGKANVVSKTQFLVPASAPEISSASRDLTKNKINVLGKNLVDTSTCGGPKLVFELVNGTATPLDVSQNVEFDSTGVILSLPASAASGAAWTLHLKVNGNEVSGSPVPLK